MSEYNNRFDHEEQQFSGEQNQNAANPNPQQYADGRNTSQPGYGAYPNGQSPYGQQPYNAYNPYNNGYGYRDPANTYGYKNAAPKKGTEEYHWNFDEYESGMAPKPKKKNKGLKVFAALLCSVFALGVLGFAGFGIYTVATGELHGISAAEESSLPSETPAPQNNAQLVLHEKPSAQITASATDSGLKGALTATEIAEKVRPSIVSIVTYTSTANYGSMGNGSLPFLATGLGSGIVMTADGYIITNAHVINGAYGVKVILENEDEYEAQIIGSDVKTDLAVLKINAENLTYAEFGDSGQLKQGETVYAFGNPYGLSLANTMTKGIISAIDRQLRGDGYTINSIQTDAAINPGNSGGALVNEFGQVVGINSAKIAETNYEGIGFAIPITEAKPIVDNLIQHGYVTGRVKFGVEVVAIDETLARYNNIPTGIMIMSINPESSFTGTNVAIGDVLVSIDGQAVSDTDTLFSILSQHKPGDQVTLKFYRRQQNGIEKHFEVTVTLIEDRGQ